MASNRMTFTAERVKSIQHRKETERTPEHISISVACVGGTEVTLHIPPEDFNDNAAHLLAARVEELLTVHENEVNDALALVDDARRDIGAQLSAIRAGIRRRFRTSTGTPAIEDFNDPTSGTLSGTNGGHVVTNADEEVGFGHDTGSTPEDMEPSDAAIDGGNDAGPGSVHYLDALYAAKRQLEATP